MNDLIFEKRFEYPVNADLFNIVVVGVGGTGSRVAMEMAKLLYHAREKNVGVQLALIDPDIVEKKNVGRQQFSPAEIGMNKAVAKARSIGAWLGIEVHALPSTVEDAGIPLIRSGYAWGNSRDFDGDGRVENIVIGCLDDQNGNAGRKAIVKAVSDSRLNPIWIDAGNDQYSGQVLVGNRCDGKIVINEMLGMVDGLPYPHIAQPALLDARETAVTPVLSCAELTMMDEQSLYINATMATVVAQYVEGIVFRKKIEAMATYVNLKPMPVVSSAAITLKSLGDARVNSPSWDNSEMGVTNRLHPSVRYDTIKGHNKTAL